MFFEIFKNLGDRYREVEIALHSKNVFEAFDLLKDREEADAIFLRGAIYILSKKYTKALYEFNKIDVEKLAGVSEDLFFELKGYCYYELKNNLEATMNYIKSIKINPNNFYSNYNLANIYIQNKNYKKSYDILKKLVKIEPENSDIINNLKMLEDILEEL